MNWGINNISRVNSFTYKINYVIADSFNESFFIRQTFIFLRWTLLLKNTGRVFSVIMKVFQTTQRDSLVIVNSEKVMIRFAGKADCFGLTNFMAPIWNESRSVVLIFTCWFRRKSEALFHYEVLEELVPFICTLFSPSIFKNEYLLCRIAVVSSV